MAVLSAVFLSLCSALVFTPRPVDPHTNGRPYSQWLERLTPSVAPSFLTASNVVRSVGTNGFPLLRAYLGAKDSRLRLFFLSKGIGADEFVAASELQVKACNAVAVMGNDADELMPLIATLLTNKVNSVRLAALRAIAANSLPFPGQDAFLTNLLVSDPILVCRAHAANALLRRGAEREPSCGTARFRLDKSPRLGKRNASVPLGDWPVKSPARAVCSFVGFLGAIVRTVHPPFCGASLPLFQRIGS